MTCQVVVFGKNIASYSLNTADFCFGSLISSLDRRLLVASLWMATKTSAKSPYVTVIADNSETLNGLNVYLSRAGVALHSTRNLRDARIVPPAVNAVVIFPDEYPLDDALATITALRLTRPQLLIVIVTSAPQHFGSAVAPAGGLLPAIVLPKPAFGWTMLDAIRAHAQAEAL